MVLAVGVGWAPAVVCRGDANDEFIQGLLDRGLVQVAENEALRRLDDPLTKPVERVQWSLRLAAAYLRHAANVGGPDRESLTKRAEETLAELLAAAPPLPRQEEIRVRRVQLHAEHGELLAWEWQYGNGGEPARAAALAALDSAAVGLRAIRLQLPEDAKAAVRRTPAQLADGELHAADVRQLERDVEHQLAATLVSYASVAPEGPQRDAAIRDADQLLQELAQGWTGDVRTWEARLLRVRLARLRGDFNQSAGLVRGALNEQPARWLADQFVAELVRGQTSSGQLDVALETLLQRSRQPGGLGDELRFLQIDALWQAQQLATRRGDAETAAAIRTQAETLAMELPGNWGSVARSRLGQEVEASRYGPRVARLVQEARAAYQSNELELATTRFQQAADLAIQEGQLAAADELDYTRGSMLIDRGEYAKAVDVFERLMDRSPDGKQTQDAGLLQAYGVGKQYAAAPADALAARYVELLEAHRRKYAGSPSAVEATAMQAAFEEARQQWSPALALYLELANHPDRGPAAQLRAAVIYEQILNHLRTNRQPVDAWEDRAVEDLAGFAHRFPTAAPQLTAIQAEIAVRLVRIVLAHREHAFAEAARLLQPVLLAAEHQRRESERNGSPVAAEWIRLSRSAAQLMIVALAGQGEIEAARQQFQQLSIADPLELLELLRGLTKLAVDVPVQYRQALAHLQLDTAQQLRLKNPDLTVEQRRQLDAAVADAYVASGNDLNAVAFYNRLLEQSPRDPERLQAAAELHQRIGAAENLRKAKGYWQQLEKLQTKGSADWLTSRLHIAECAVALGEKAEAQKLIRLTRLVYPELGTAELRERFATVEAAAR
jgi:tetratricopeptide (TPR) repeat protein